MKVLSLPDGIEWAEPGFDKSAHPVGSRDEQIVEPAKFLKVLSVVYLPVQYIDEPRSLTSLREKLIEIGAKVVSHGRYVTFQTAEVAVSRHMFAEILSLIAHLRAPPEPA